ncbi:MAG: hypothetical protein ACYTG7_09300 [Planctomycetota bacterium]
MAIDGGGLKVRLPEELTFAAWDKKSGLERGTTIQSGIGSASLNFMGSVQVELSKNSVLVLEGEVSSAAGKSYVLGLMKGEVHVNSSADFPIILKMPHAEVSGLHAYFKVKLQRYEEGTYSAVVKAFSPNILVKNRFGMLPLPNWAEVRIDEKEPPRLLKDLRRPGR